MLTECDRGAAEVAESERPLSARPLGDREASAGGSRQQLVRTLAHALEVAVETRPRHVERDAERVERLAPLVR